MKILLLIVALLMAWPRVGLGQTGQMTPALAPFDASTKAFDKTDPNIFYPGSFHFDGGPSVPIIPNYTLFGGFTLVRNRFAYGSTGVPGSPASPGPVFYLNGWDASIERKFAPWVGIVADVSRQSGTRSGSYSGPEQENQISLLFGPQFSWRVAHRFIPFAHVLIGPSYGLATYLSPGTTSTVSSFATAIGGGVDVKIFGPVWLRAPQVDYLHASNDFGEDHRMQFRIAAGIAFRF